MFLFYFLFLRQCSKYDKLLFIRGTSFSTKYLETEGVLLLSWSTFKSQRPYQRCNDDGVSEKGRRERKRRDINIERRLLSTTRLHVLMTNNISHATFPHVNVYYRNIYFMWWSTFIYNSELYLIPTPRLLCYVNFFFLSIIDIVLLTSTYICVFLQL